VLLTETYDFRFYCKGGKTDLEDIPVLGLELLLMLPLYIPETDEAPEHCCRVRGSFIPTESIMLGATRPLLVAGAPFLRRNALRIRGQSLPHLLPLQIPTSFFSLYLLQTYLPPTLLLIYSQTRPLLLPHLHHTQKPRRKLRSKWNRALRYYFLSASLHRIAPQL